MTDEGWQLLWWTLPTSIVMFAFVSAVARVVRKRWSRTGWFQLLGSPALLFPTGIHGAATRDDVRRRATRLTLAGPVLVGVAIVVGNASARFEPLSRASLSFQVYAGIVGTV